jgi:hypothetical protein
MSGSWRPITRDEFDAIVADQLTSLDSGQYANLETFRVQPREAIIRRSSQCGDERVWVIAERHGQVLYFDDVEWGWNWSEVDREDRILRTGGGQGELRDVLGSECGPP